MKKTMMKRLSSLILCVMLTVAMALCTTGCGDQQEKPMTGGSQGTENSTLPENSQSDDTESDVTVLGEGAVIFTFTVVDGNGKETVFEIHTDKTVVGDALLEHGLISGEESEFGLYVKTVNGITADYDVDGTYWAFYVNGEYAMSGVDTTSITEGDSYSFEVSK